jgi:hypothetical protein
LIYFVARLNGALDENGPSGSSSPSAMARPTDLMPEVDLRLHSTTANRAHLGGDLASQVTALEEIVRKGEQEMDKRISIMNKIIALAVLLTNGKQNSMDQS